jgi:hypothetical protein
VEVVDSDLQRDHHRHAIRWGRLRHFREGHLLLHLHLLRGGVFQTLVPFPVEAEMREVSASLTCRMDHEGCRAIAEVDLRHYRPSPPLERMC